MKVNQNAVTKDMDSLTALIRLKKEIRSLDGQIRKASNKDVREKLQRRKLMLERNFRIVRGVSFNRGVMRRADDPELRRIMGARSRQFMSPGDGIETAALKWTI